MFVISVIRYRHQYSADILAQWTMSEITSAKI